MRAFMAGGIVARYSRGVVWAWRALPSGPGWHQAPAYLFFPFLNRSLGAKSWSVRGLVTSPWNFSE